MAKPVSTDPDVAGKLQVRPSRCPQTACDVAWGQELNRRVTATAEEIVFHTFPQKVRSRGAAPSGEPDPDPPPPADPVRGIMTAGRAAHAALVRRQLTALVESMHDAASPLHRAHMYSTTDATVYPPPSPPSPAPAAAPDTKKRKRAEDPPRAPGNDAAHAQYPSLVLANQHVKKVSRAPPRPSVCGSHGSQAQDLVRQECEDLIELCVSRARSSGLSWRIHNAAWGGQDKVKLWVSLTMPKYAAVPFPSLDAFR